jgi:hypothetical protein
MRPVDPRPRRLRRSRPIVEGLEVRELLSTANRSAAPPHSGLRHDSVAVQAHAQQERAATRQDRRASARQAHTDSPNGLQGVLPSGRFLNPKVIQQFAPLLYPPGSATGTATPREIQRETFTGRWVGRYTVGAPRFSDRASTIHAYGTDGGSNQFLKGKLDLVLFPPADPGATPTPGNPYANQVTGIVGLINQNLLQSGGVLVLDLNGTPTPGSDPLALPTHLTWTYDANTSAGQYAAPALFTQGAGILDIKWFPDAHPFPGTRGSGKLIVTFQGLINYSQLVSPISKVIS